MTQTNTDRQEWEAHGRFISVKSKVYRFANADTEEQAAEIVRDHNDAVRMREALEKVLPFSEKELECREASYLPEPLSADERYYLTEAKEAVEAIRAALAGGKESGKNG